MDRKQEIKLTLALGIIAIIFIVGGWMKMKGGLL